METRSQTAKVLYYIAMGLFITLFSVSLVLSVSDPQGTIEEYHKLTFPDWLADPTGDCQVPGLDRGSPASLAGNQGLCLCGLPLRSAAGAWRAHCHERSAGGVSNPGNCDLDIRVHDGPDLLPSAAADNRCNACSGVNTKRFRLRWAAPCRQSGCLLAHEQPLWRQQKDYRFADTCHSSNSVFRGSLPPEQTERTSFWPCVSATV